MRNSFARLTFARVTQCWTSAQWGDIGCQIGGLNLSWDRGFRQPDFAVQSVSVFFIIFWGVGGDPFCVKSGSPRSAEFSCCACRCFLVLIFMCFLFNLFTKGFCLVQAHLTFRGPVLRCGSGGRPRNFNTRYGIALTAVGFGSKLVKRRRKEMCTL